jgi:lipopolysaccharide/colanic/teichoic acid biosynthesis glycosyltransferase
VTLTLEAVSVRPITTGKRAMDIVVATALLVLTAPLFLLIALIVRRDGGPILFSQRRVGTGGRIFEVQKFRSMAVDAEERLLADPDLHARYIANGFKLPADEDPRITRWGRFLRASSLDELPQLVSVLRGDMTMVGPRPIVEPELVEYRSRDAEDAYLSARPGLTGLWQVNGRSLVDYDQRVELDLRYLAERTVLCDLRILAKTVVVVLGRAGAY